MTIATPLATTETQALKLEEQLSTKTAPKKPARRTDLTAKKDEGQYREKVAIINDEVLSIDSQVYVGERPNGVRHKVDLLLGGTVYFDKPTHKCPYSHHTGGILVSLKTQSTNGTKEFCLADEAIDLQYLIDTHGYNKAIIVMAGRDHNSETGTEGWTRRQMYLNPESYPRKRLASACPNVEFMDEETFKQTFSICPQHH